MQEGVLALVLQEQKKQQLEAIVKMNERISRYGLSLSKEEAALLVEGKNRILKQQRRVEFSSGILPKLMEAFCDSSYIEQENWAETLQELLDIFFTYKNEAQDKLTDDELLHFMKEQFDGVCFGSMEYLGSTCLERFARAVRAGYEGYVESEGEGGYLEFSEEAGWDSELFLEAWNELIS